MRGKLGGSAGEGTVEHGDLRFWAQRGAQRDALVERRDKKQPAAGRRQRAGYGRRPETVGIGLDDRGTLRRRCPFREQTPIGDDRAEIDLEQGAGAGGGIRGHRVLLRRQGCQRQALRVAAAELAPASSCKSGSPGESGTDLSSDGVAEQWVPAFARTLKLRRELLGADEIVELCRLGLEMQLHGADRAVALLGDDNISEAIGRLTALFPALVAVVEFFRGLLRAMRRLGPRQVILLAENEHDDVGVLKRAL